MDILRELEERAVVSVPWHAAPCAVDEDGDEWWEREREGGARAGGSLLEHDDAVDEGGPEGGAESCAPLELTWWRSRIPRTAHHGGGGRATSRSTVTHPSTTPSRATPTSCSVLASAWIYERETERDRERTREDKDGLRVCGEIFFTIRVVGSKFQTIIGIG
jgi:hypothetical protein